MGYQVYAWGHRIIWRHIILMKMFWPDGFWMATLVTIHRKGCCPDGCSLTQKLKFSRRGKKTVFLFLLMTEWPTIFVMLLSIVHFTWHHFYFCVVFTVLAKSYWARLSPRISNMLTRLQQTRPRRWLPLDTPYLRPPTFAFCSAPNEVLYWAESMRIHSSPLLFALHKFKKIASKMATCYFSKVKKAMKPKNLEIL